MAFFIGSNQILSEAEKYKLYEDKAQKITTTLQNKVRPMHGVSVHTEKSKIDFFKFVDRNAIPALKDLRRNKQFIVINPEEFKVSVEQLNRFADKMRAEENETRHLNLFRRIAGIFLLRGPRTKGEWVRKLARDLDKNARALQGDKDSIIKFLQKQEFVGLQEAPKETNEIVFAMMRRCGSALSIEDKGDIFNKLINFNMQADNKGLIPF